MLYRFILFGLILFVQSNGFAQTAFDTLVPFYRDTFYFDSGKAEIKEAAAAKMERAFAQWNPPAQLHLTGHTDAIGSDSYNQQLAQRRVAAIARPLLALGFPDSLLFTDVFGESLPVADNEAEDGRQQNRRVTLGLYRQQKMLPFKGRVVDAETGQGISARLRFHGKGFSDSLSTDSSGRYRYLLPEGAIVGREIFAKGYFFKSEMFKAVFSDLPDAEVKLGKAETGRSMDLPDFYFYGNRADLLPKSVPQLANLKKFMDINPGLSVEIEGHINRPNYPPVEKDTWNFQLSVNRAKLVYEYLIAKGVEPQRIRYQGYGNSRMRFPQARSEADQAANRRVEIRVLGERGEE